LEIERGQLWKTIIAVGIAATMDIYNIVVVVEQQILQCISGEPRVRYRQLFQVKEGNM
jgi:hypothetical protein